VKSTLLAVVLVNLQRIKYLLAYDLPSVVRMLTKETAFVALVTGSPAKLFDFQQNRVSIAVDIDGTHPLTVAARFTFFPNPIPAATIVDRLARLNSFFPRRLVHVGQHQYLTSVGVLRHGGQ